MPIHVPQDEVARRLQDVPHTSSASARPASLRSSTTARSSHVPHKMPEPTLGCQIGPHYDREQWPYNSDSDTTDSESEAGSPQEQIEEALAIEKKETQHSCGITPALSKINTQRSKRSHKEVAPQAPVGFWHWQMVR